MNHCFYCSWGGCQATDKVSDRRCIPLLIFQNRGDAMKWRLFYKKTVYIYTFKHYLVNKWWSAALDIGSILLLYVYASTVISSLETCAALCKTIRILPLYVYASTVMWMGHMQYFIIVRSWNDVEVNNMFSSIDDLNFNFTTAVAVLNSVY